jgi:ABC-type branched-subunit amino acid transport system substrate-binding protein
MKETRVLGKVKLIGGLNMLSIADVPAELLEGSVAAAPDFSVQGGAADSVRAAFVSAYKARFSKEPNFDAAFAYDGMMLLGTVLGKGGGDPVKTKQALAQVTGFRGATGTISMQPDGNSSNAWSMVIYRGGKWEPLVAGSK